MEELLFGIKSQTIELTGLDTQGSFANIPFVFFYENSLNDSDFMDSKLLHESFIRTILQVPVLVGHICAKGRGHTRVVIDGRNLNMPDYRESSSDIHFDDLKADGFNWRSWPPDVNTIGPMTQAGAEGKIKPINIHIIRLRNNSGVMVYISMTHYMADSHGYMAVVKRWSEIHQLLLGKTPEKIADLPSLVINRATIQQSLPKERLPVNSETKETFTKFSLLAELFAWISPKVRGHIASKVVKRQNAETHLFHVSYAALDSLRQSIGEHVSDVSKVTDSDLIMALTTKIIVQAQQKTKKGNGKTKTISRLLDHGNDKLPLAVVFEVRDRLGMADINYVGNALIPKILLKSVKDLQTPVTFKYLGQTVTDFGDITHDLSAPYIASHIDMIMPRPSSFTRPLARFITEKDALTYIYDLTPNMYEVDFGAGKPCWVSPIQPFRVNLTQLLTSKDPNEGVDVFISLYPGVMKEVLNNEFWNKVAKIIY
ncbi:hypothetical protein H4R99_000381 [Coemansia sp. RSA 1722]|nr:hypothetical protein IWW45_004413 [Coemansia sp. RSA 485]KAJ2606360.1 hypothetical protein H4R99_000381 [Coemansia sp. RSA 1722]